MLLDTTLQEETDLLEIQNNNAALQTGQQNQQQNYSGSGYSGSTFAGILVIILFVIWALYKMGCIGNN